ncbi:hypothetical protein CLV43_111331 [Umezawaea tangerina]|uniref:Uncharacterized protein n=2 Tax=Umezawaea tangerina TaxID=84725 RepID=A0A2T0SU67_9PSEU|nr:hypothetical protein CLV43_111331 [Umezawaea tangerina]
MPGASDPETTGDAWIARTSTDVRWTTTESRIYPSAVVEAAERPPRASVRALEEKA